MKHRIAHLLIITCLALVATPQSAVFADVCYEEDCRCASAVSPEHCGSTHETAFPACEAAAVCCRLQAPDSRDALLTIQSSQVSHHPLVRLVSISSEEAPSSLSWGPVSGFEEKFYPGPTIPAYIQNSSLLC